MGVRGTGAKEGGFAGLDDESLVQVAIHDQNAFAELLMRHRRVLEAACATVDMSSQDRLDALQEARLALWKGLPSFRGESAVSSWMYTVTRRAALGWLRSGRRHRTDLANSNESIDLRTQEGVDESTADLLLTWPAVAALDADHRDVLVMHAFGGMSHHEIAAVMNIAEGTSKARLSRARTELARSLRVVGS